MSADESAALRSAVERQELHWRLGCMADALLSAKLGPRQRFFSRERVDEIVLLLREAEKALLAVKEERRAAEALSRFGEATGASPWT